MKQEKIKELKKIMGFGLLIRDAMKCQPEIEIAIKTLPVNELIPLLARLVIGHDVEFEENEMCRVFKEPTTTELLEEVYAEYTAFKKADEEKEGEKDV